MTEIPLLETERLVLRGHTREDFPAFAEMWADHEVNRFIGGTPLSEEESWGKFLRTFGQWEVTGFGFWSIVEKHGGKRIGEAGFVDGRRNIVPSLSGTPECGWSLARSAQGNGYATEAVRAALAWGDAHFGKIRMACIIAPDNTASLRVAAKTGFRVAHHTSYRNAPTVMLYRDP